MSLLDLIDILPVPIIAINKVSRAIHINHSFQTRTGFNEKQIDQLGSSGEKIFASGTENLSILELDNRIAGAGTLSVDLKGHTSEEYKVRSAFMQAADEEGWSILAFEPERRNYDRPEHAPRDSHVMPGHEKGWNDLEKEVYEKTHELSSLYEISRAMNSSQSLEDFVRFILEAINKITGSDCSLMLLVLDKNPIIFFSLVRFIGEGDLSALKMSAFSSFNELSSNHAHEAQTVFYRTTDYLSDAFPASAIGDPHWIPLYRRNLPIGMIGICSSDRSNVDESKVRLLYTISNQASATLDRFLSLRESEQSRFRSAVNSMTEGVILADLTGHALMTNPAAEKIMSKLDLKTDTRFVESVGSRELKSGIAHIKKGKTLSFSEEIQFSKFQTILNITASAVLDAKEKMTGIVFVLSDITRQRQMQEQMIQTEKLSALGELISGVAHELNNPLASVIGYAQLLQSAQVPGDVKKKLEVINSESKRCQRIVEDLLTFARKHRFEMKRIDVNSAIDSVLQLISYQCKVNGIELEKNYSKGIPRIVADLHQIQQVFLNILSNALQALIESKKKRTICIGTSVTDRSVTVEFKDNGPGIREENIRRVFDPFFTTKGAGRGTGLGLSIARGTVREHGGDIDVSSIFGKGTAFTVRFPVTKDVKAKEPAALSHHETDCIPKKRKILVVDDEKQIYHMIEEALRCDEHILGYACNGSDAIDELQATDYDLIISDLKMPIMDGKELFAQVNKKYPHLKDRFIFITGDTAGHSTSEFVRKKKVKLLAKPFDVDDIKKAVREIFLKA